ncbi:MAG: hypothetical protein CXT73_07190 [Methanobacteriota archaeon]|nr:MAG: hypothetical protein CXT73_07190 [Euryarchaeota archaeon]
MVGHKRNFRKWFLEHIPAKTKCMKIEPFSEAQKAFWTFINVHFHFGRSENSEKKCKMVGHK